MTTKISKLIEAGRTIEKNKTGFSVPELLTTLNWSDSEKQYVQTTLVVLVKRGQLQKISKTKPVIYSFKSNGNNASEGEIFRSGASVTNQMPNITKATQTAPQIPNKVEQPIPSQKEPVISLEDLANMDITLEMIGQGVFQRNRELERRIYELETELVDFKRRLDDANKTISEKTRMIEKQNQIITDQNQDSRMTVKLKKASSGPWNR